MRRRTIIHKRYACQGYWRAKRVTAVNSLTSDKDKGAVHRRFDGEGAFVRRTIAGIRSRVRNG